MRPPMSSLDNPRQKADTALSDPSPEQKQRIEQIARDKELTIEEARDLFLIVQDKDQDTVGVV